MEINNIKALILDMDGVLWRGGMPLGDLQTIFSKINQIGLQYTFATNNATRHIDEYLEKISGFGIPVKSEQIFTSAKATAEYLKEIHPEGGIVFVVGEKGLKRTLEEYGFSLGDKDVIAVVAGLDTEINYSKLSQATMLIRNGAPFIGTNPDLTYPIPEGLAPGAGAIIASIEASTGVKAEIIGKPRPVMFQQAMSFLGTTPDETLVVGDRLETDIAGGQAAGCRCAVVLTGVSTQEMAEAWKPDPDIICESLTKLVELIK